MIKKGLHYFYNNRILPSCIKLSGKTDDIELIWIKKFDDKFPGWHFFSGFMKYERSTNMYRPAKERMNDWEEIYRKKSKRELKVQAAR